MTPELVTYVVNAIEQGNTNEEIISDLLGQGIRSEAIAEAFVEAYEVLGIQAQADQALGSITRPLYAEPLPPSQIERIKKKDAQVIGMVIAGGGLILLLGVALLAVRSLQSSPSLITDSSVEHSDMMPEQNPAPQRRGSTGVNEEHAAAMQTVCRVSDAQTRSLRSTVNGYRDRLYEFENALQTLTNSSMSNFERMTNDERQVWSEQAADLELQASVYARSYATSSQELVAQELALVPDAAADALYEQYCSPRSTFVFIRPNYSTEAELAVDKMSIPTMMCDMGKQSAANTMTHIQLNSIGFAYMSTGQFDRGMDFYQCAAKKFANMKSMYRLSQAYYRGSDALLEVYSERGIEPTITQSISPDYQEAFFWTSTLLVLSSHFDGPYHDSNTGSGWNTIAMYDQMINGREREEIDFADAESRVLSYVQQKFGNEVIVVE